ncbi:MAG: haloalkane dehalogenase [Thermoleophilaceae bacterium]|nr:haloalkane dehalogenase [Thermoleophilaceae bacterium]
MGKRAEVVAAHRAAGREFEADGVQSFVREEGRGEAVVCMHGVPASCFLYRNVLPELAARGLRGIAFDLPGLGLAARPESYDYTWTGLGRFSIAAIDALGLDDFHLVVHDIGGPVGLEIAAAMPERIRSLLILNTLIEVADFHRPWMMEPFARRGIGPIYVATLNGVAWNLLMANAGVGDMSKVPREELAAYVDLLKREDGGRAFLKVMRGFERTKEKQDLYVGTLQAATYPKRVLWGADDPALTLEKMGEQARRSAGVDKVHTVPGKHFLQEDQPAAVAQHVAELAAEANASSGGSLA